jgi:hypothetical protein
MGGAVELHLAVRDVVDQVGPGVLADPDNFRGVLDDVLDEDAADAGEVNLLVDAVRFGALAQLVRLLDSDADVLRAVETAASGFARLRGGADPTASRWACAVLGFAIRRVPEGVVIDLASRLPSRRGTVEPAPSPPPPAPNPTRPVTAPPPPPQRSAPPPPVYGQPAAPPPYAATTGSSRGSAAKIVAVVGLVLAIVAAGYLGWRFFWPRGGADSPEEAVEKLMLAVADQDPLALVDVVSPAEAEGLDDVYDALRERAEDEDLVEDDDAITDALDLEFSGLSFGVEQQGDDLARVALVGGQYDASWDPSDLPDRLDFLAAEAPADQESGELVELFEGEKPTVTTIRIDGRWYVTLVGTAADYTYQELEDEADDRDFDLEDPDYDLTSEDTDPITGEDAEAVIDELFQAVESGDAEEVLSNLPEDFVKPLRPYIPVYEGLRRDGNWFEGELAFDANAEALDLDTEDLDDGKVKVTISSGTFGVTYMEDGANVGSNAIAVDGDCIEVYADGALQDSGCIGDDEAAADLGLDEIFFVVSEEDGGYQFDPGATLVEYAATVVDGLTGDVVDRIIEDLES